MSRRSRSISRQSWGNCAGTHGVGKVARQQRRVAVVEMCAEPDNAAHAPAQYRKRQDEENAPVAPTDHDRGRDSFPAADVALPGRNPVKGLKGRAVGLRLEGPPLRLEADEIVMQRQVNAKARVGHSRIGGAVAIRYFGLGTLCEYGACHT